MTTITIPTLSTQRLVLRGFTAADLDALASIYADPQVSRYIGDGLPADRAATWWALAGMLGHWQLEMLFLAGRCRAPRPAHCPRMTSVWEQQGLAPGITQPGSSLCADGADGDQGSRLVASCH
jgi:hypothetical protein